jgi:hypothetical protein
MIAPTWRLRRQERQRSDRDLAEQGQPAGLGDRRVRDLVGRSPAVPGASGTRPARRDLDARRVGLRPVQVRRPEGVDRLHVAAGNIGHLIQGRRPDRHRRGDDVGAGLDRQRASRPTARPSTRNFARGSRRCAASSCASTPTRTRSRLRATTPPGVQSYGFTVDQDGNPWFGGNCGPVTVFDQKNQSLPAIAGTGGCWRGVTADEKYVWVANNSPCGLQIDRANAHADQELAHQPVQHGDRLQHRRREERVAGRPGRLGLEVRPGERLGMKKVDVVGSHYVYSDMTGGQVRSILPQ